MKEWLPNYINANILIDNRCFV